MIAVLPRVVIGLLVILPFTRAVALERLDGIAAIVNDSVITEKALQEAQQFKFQGEQNTEVGNPISQRTAQLEQLILDKLQMQYAEMTGIHIDDMTLDNTISNIAKENGKSIEGLRAILAQEGIDFPAYRENIRKHLMINQLQHRDIEQYITVSEQEIDRFLHSVEGLDTQGTEYQLSHILITLPRAPSPEAVAEAQSLAEAVVNAWQQTADFSTLAKTNTAFSQLEATALGWRKIPALPTLFTDVVPFMTVGAVRGPIRSASGLHIIQLSDKRQAPLPDTQRSEMHVRHILLKPDDGLAAIELEKKLAQLRAESLAPEGDFASLAKTHSDDLGTQRQGGDLGWITQDAVVPEFREAVNQLQVGEISAPFQTPFGWHIAQLLDKRDIDPHTLHRSKAKQLIHQRKVAEKKEAWLHQLREEAYVQISQSKAGE